MANSRALSKYLLTSWLMWYIAHQDVICWTRTILLAASGALIKFWPVTGPRRFVWKVLFVCHRNVCFVTPVPLLQFARDDSWQIIRAHSSKLETNRGVQGVLLWTRFHILIKVTSITDDQYISICVVASTECVARVRHIIVLGIGWIISGTYHRT